MGRLFWASSRLNNQYCSYMQLWSVMLFRCFEISLLGESQVNNIVTDVSFGMTLGVTVSVVLHLVQPGSHRNPSLVLRNNAMIESLPNRLKPLQTFPIIFPQSFLQATSFLFHIISIYFILFQFISYYFNLFHLISIYFILFLCLVTVWGQRYDLVWSLRHSTARTFVKSSPRTCRMMQDVLIQFIMSHLLRSVHGQNHEIQLKYIEIHWNTVIICNYM